MRLTVSTLKKDLLDLYWLLYPMLDDAQKSTTEGQKASHIAEKYGVRPIEQKFSGRAKIWS